MASTKPDGLAQGDKCVAVRYLDQPKSALAALVRRVLARDEADVRRQPRKLLALSRVESRKQRDLPDLLLRHHGSVLMGISCLVTRRDTPAPPARAGGRRRRRRDRACRRST